MHYDILCRLPNALLLASLSSYFGPLPSPRKAPTLTRTGLRTYEGLSNALRHFLLVSNAASLGRGEACSSPSQHLEAHGI